MHVDVVLWCLLNNRAPRLCTPTPTSRSSFSTSVPSVLAQRHPHTPTLIFQQQFVDAAVAAAKQGRLRSMGAHAARGGSAAAAAAASPPTPRLPTPHTAQKVLQR